MLLWAITVEDILDGLRERGLQCDLTRRELDFVTQYVDSTLDEASYKLLAILVARIRQERGRNE